MDVIVGQLRDIPFLGTGTGCKLAWSSREDSFYLRSGKDYLEISLGPDVVFQHLAAPPGDFADHYGRMGNTENRDGCFYTSHEEGGLKLFVAHGWGSQVSVFRQNRWMMRIKDPTGGLRARQAIFLAGGKQLLAEIGDHVYLADVAAKRVGPVLRGERFIALTTPFSKHVDF